MKNRIISTALLLACIFTLFGAYPASAETAAQDGFEKAVLDYINPDFRVYSDGEYASTVGFIADIYGLTGISREEENTDEITYFKAARACLEVLNYGVICDKNSDAGCLSFAAGLGIFDGVPARGEEKVTAADATKIYYNTLNAALAEPVSYSGDYRKTDKTILSEYYSIYFDEDVVNANDATALTSADARARDGSVRIGTRECISSAPDSLLGYNVCYCYQEKDGDNILVAMKKKGNREQELGLYGVDRVEDFKLYYDADGADKKYRLDEAFAYIYNGKAVIPEDTSELFNDKSGRVVLTDNDNDGKYDVVSVKAYRYMYVERVDTYKRVIYDAISGDNIVDLSDSDCKYSIKGADGTALTIFDVGGGDVLAVSTSADGLLCEIVVCEETIKGTISGRETDDDGTVITIGENKYRLSEYALQREAQYTSGAYASFILGIAGDIAYASFRSSDMEYGWVVRSLWDAESDCAIVKIFTENDKIETFNISEKCSFDGVRIKDIDACIDELQGLPNSKRFIRYGLNADGELNRVDYAEVPKPSEMYSSSGAENNRLKLYFDNVTAQYISSTYWMMPYFHVSTSTKVFVVPKSDKDRYDEKKYKIKSFTYVGSVASPVSAYDMDESGCPGAVVCMLDNVSGDAVTGDDISYVIEKKYTGLNPEGDLATVLSVWDCNYGTYGTYYSTEETQAVIDTVGKGDIVRFLADNDNNITALEVDFSLADYSISADKLTVGARLSYVVGNLYSYASGYANLLPRSSMSLRNRESISALEFTAADMINYNFSRRGYVFVEVVRSKSKVYHVRVYNGNESDFICAKNAGDGADLVVGRTRYGDYKQTVIYKIEYTD